MAVRLFLIIFLIFPLLIFAQIDSDDSEIQVIYRSDLFYPDSLKEVGIEGRVKMIVEVKSDSTLGRIDFVESIPELETIAEKNIKNWEFTPAYKDGTPINSFIEIDLNFPADYTTKKEKKESEDVPDIKKETLKKRVLAFKKQNSRNLFRIPVNFQRENNHIYSNQIFELRAERNDFTDLLLYQYPSLSLQNYLPFYNLKYYPGKLSYEYKNYYLPAAITDFSLGSGNNNMNYARVSFEKGQLLGLEQTGIKFDFMTDQGFFLYHEQKREDFNVSVYKKILGNEITINYLTLNSEIFKDNIISSNFETVSGIMNQNSTQISYRVKNKFLEFGYKNQQQKFTAANRKKRTDFTNYMVKRNIRIKEQFLGFKYEYIQEKHNELKLHTYSLKDSLKFNNLTSTGDFMFQNKGNCNYQTNLIYNLNLLAVGAGFNRNMREYTPEKFSYKTDYYYAKIGLNHKKVELAIQTGWKDWLIEVDDSDTIWNLKREKILNSKLYSNMKLPIYKFYITSENNIIYNGFDELYYKPKLRLKGNISLLIPLKHKNRIELGFEYNYHSDYRNLFFNYVDLGYRYNAFLEIGITDLFEIRGDLINITSEEYFMGNMNYSYYSKFRFRWYLFN